MAYSPKAIKEAYDEIAAKEDGFEKRFSLRNEIPREFIKDYLRASDVVLDAGGGTGINAVIMAQRCRHVTLVDISPKILEQAAVNIRKAGLTDKIRLIEGDIANLKQLGNGEFTFVVCVGGSLSYVLERGPVAIQELVRVAKEGSILIVGCDGKYGFVRWLVSQGQWEAARKVYEANQYEAGEGAYARLYTAAELKGLLQEAGCDVIEMASSPVLESAWDQSAYAEEEQKQLKILQLELEI